jgi:hypothetical protein
MVRLPMILALITGEDVSKKGTKKPPTLEAEGLNRIEDGGGSLSL